MTIQVYSDYAISKYGFQYFIYNKKKMKRGKAQVSKEREKDNKDIKELEKWVYHSLVCPKANRCGFVVASGI